MYLLISFLNDLPKINFIKSIFDEPIIVRNPLQCKITIYYIYYKNIISINNMYLAIFQEQFNVREITRTKSSI
jgi:hypothetical protein